MFRLTLLRELIFRFSDDQVFDLSAQCAYYFLLSLFPFLIFAVTLLGFLPITTDDILQFIDAYAPGRTTTLIENNVRNIVDVQNTGLLSLGFVFTLWSASHAINAIIRSLNKAYDVEEFRPFWKARLVSISLTIAMIFVIVIALTLTVFGEKIGSFLYDLFHMPKIGLFLWETLRFVISFIILNIVFTTLYRFGPNKKLQMKEVLLGSLIASVGWQITSLGFAYYVNHFANFTATYGSLGGVIVLMLWFQFSAMILIMGGQINAILQARDV